MSYSLQCQRVSVSAVAKSYYRECVYTSRWYLLYTSAISMLYELMKILLYDCCGLECLLGLSFASFIHTNSTTKGG